MLFDDFLTAAEAVRAISQPGLHPANCRAVDEMETEVAGDGSQSMLVLLFESAHHPVGHWFKLAFAFCADHSGRPIAETNEAARRGGAGGKYTVTTLPVCPSTAIL